MSNDSSRKYPLVSVIIPNYNYVRFLPERIESVLSQSFQDFELIILDDCSTDNSAEVINRYRDNPKVTRVVYNTKNSGSPFAQWEKGISLAQGKYIWIAEADDSALPDFLQRSVAVLEADEEVALVKTMSYLIDGEGKKFNRPYFENYEPDGKTRIYDGDSYIEHRMIRHNDFYNASTVVFRRDAWAALNDKSYMRMRYTGDWLFWGLLMSGKRVAEVAERLSRFRFHGGSVTDEGKVSARAVFESKATIAILSLRLPHLEKSTRRYIRYQIDKLFRRQRYSAMAETLFGADTNEFKQYTIPASKYPFYWIYKHLLWKSHKHQSASTSSIQPIAVL